MHQASCRDQTTMRFTPLQAGDTVALTCPGSVCIDAQHPLLAQDYLLKNYQLQSVFNQETTEKTSPKARADILLSYLFDDNIKLIAALRGGEGTADILPYLHQHFDDIKKLKPKPLLGLSDFTALLIYFDQYYQWPVIHGPSPLQFALNRVEPETEIATMDLLFGNPHTMALQTLSPLNACAQETQCIEAMLTGGNLSLIDISIKDIWEIETKHKILFFEDVNEKAHKIIRFLKYFSRIGLFKEVKAIILGDFTSDPIGFTEAEQDINKKNILNILKSFADHHQLPVLYTPHIGHGKMNMPLVYHTPYRLELGEQPKLLHSHDLQ